MTRAEVEKVTRRYVAELADVLGMEKDIPAPDVNTDEQIMAWVMDTYSRRARHGITSLRRTLCRYATAAFSIVATS